MRVFITLIFVFFSHLFVNVAQAAPHTNAEKKASASTDDKRLKKNQTTKTAKKPQTPPELPKKKATQEKSKAQPEKKAVEKKTKIARNTQPTKTTANNKKISANIETKDTAPKTTSSRYHSATPSKLVKRLKKGADATEEKTATIKSGAKKAVKKLVLSEAHNRRYQHAKMTAMNKLMSQIGKPYQWGGNSPYTGFDCSGLVYYAYKDVVKIPIPRTANEMYHLRNAAPINKGELEIGDLVFFRINGRGTADHVGVYLGNGKFIQSPRTGDNIKISKLSEYYWQKHYIGARRVVTPQTIR
ncbi:MAG: NlpC/P60 family protein [Symbiopectobacterium sp.]